MRFRLWSVAFLLTLARDGDCSNCRTTPRQMPDPDHSSGCLFSVVSNQTDPSFGDLQRLCVQNFGTLALYPNVQYQDQLSHLNPTGSTQILLAANGVKPSDAAFWKPVSQSKGVQISTVCRSECPNPIEHVNRSAMDASQLHNTTQQNKLHTEISAKLQHTDAQIAQKRRSVERLRAHVRDLRAVYDSLAAQQLPGACPPLGASPLNTEWLPFPTGCFLVVRYNLTFDQTARACQHYGGQLARLHDGAESRLAQQLVREHAPTGVGWASRWWFQWDRCRSDRGAHCRCPATMAQVQWRPLHCMQRHYALCQILRPHVVNATVTTPAP